MSVEAASATWRNRIVRTGDAPLSEIVANVANWRTHPKHQADALAGVLDAVGFVQQVVINARSGRLVDGHLRVELAERHGESSVPAVWVDLSHDEERLILATLDPLGALAGSDDAALRSLLATVSTSDDALAAMLAELGASAGIVPAGNTADDPGAQIDRAEELRQKWGTERGQLWEIGRHRLLCGDATSAEDVARLMGGEQVALCFTSPPYAQQRDYGQKISNWDALMQGVFENIPMKSDGQVLVNLGLVHDDGEWSLYWDSWIASMRSAGWRRFGWYVWDQGTGLHGDWGGRFAPCFEFVFHFNREAVHPKKTRPCKTAGRVNTNAGLREVDGSRAQVTTVVQPFAVEDAIIRDVHRETSPYGDHPAAFPVGLPRHFFAAWDGDVYDPFSGSGTTMVAAEQTGRICYGLEIEPKYIAVTLERLSGMGLTARLV